MVLLLLLLLASPIPAEGEAVRVSAFSEEGGLAGWKAKSFEGHTRYRLENGALCARSENSASGLYRELQVDLTQTPILEWEWKVQEGVRARDELSKEGDDYPARVYVIFDGGFAFWRTRAINYVWASSQEKGANWPSAFTDNSRMVAVESGSQHQGQWVRERRNVLEDFRTLFKESPGSPDALAIMTDTDNAGGRAAACYRKLRFTSGEPMAGDEGGGTLGVSR